jgi:hypothetical protein
MHTPEDGRGREAYALAYAALQAVEAHTRAGHLRCPVCRVLAGATHADDCVLARALAALGPLVPERAES